jgi:hypothetical protein
MLLAVTWCTGLKGGVRIANEVSRPDYITKAKKLTVGSIFVVP